MSAPVRPLRGAIQVGQDHELDPALLPGVLDVPRVLHVVTVRTVPTPPRNSRAPLPLRVPPLLLPRPRPRPVVPVAGFVGGFRVQQQHVFPVLRESRQFGRVLAGHRRTREVPQLELLLRHSAHRVLDQEPRGVRRLGLGVRQEDGLCLASLVQQLPERRGSLPVGHVYLYRVGQLGARVPSLPGGDRRRVPALVPQEYHRRVLQVERGLVQDVPRVRLARPSKHLHQPRREVELILGAEADGRRARGTDAAAPRVLFGRIHRRGRGGDGRAITVGGPVVNPGGECARR